MIDNKIRKKLEKILKDIDTDKISQISEMIKSGGDIKGSIDLDKASSLIKSLNLENEITPDMISQGIDKLKENPDILSELTKKK